ncbi:MAG: hypothetical protein IKN63_05020 [Bacilli bacterium]|nr:hypothetical protein [Bacilli bacterium]
MKYSFKDILSGLRYEYLNIKNKLDKLEKEINIVDSELSKSIILLDDEEGITCYFYNSQKHIIDAIINISKSIGMPLFNLENLELDSSVKSIYHFKNNLKHYHIIIENIRAFNDQILNILSNNFIFMMKKKNIEVKYNNQDYIIGINYNHIGQYLKDFESGLTSIDYYPRNDFIKLDFIKTLNNEELNEKLNIKYDVSLFNDYQKEIIEKHKKDIVLFDDEIRAHEFRIEEEEKRLVLVRR